MNTLRADGMTEVTLRGPAPQNTRQTAARRGPARGNSRRRRRRKPNTRRRPKNANTAERSAPKSKLITDQRERGLCPRRESPEDPALHPVAPQIGMRHQPGGGAVLLCLSKTPGPTPDHTRPVNPDPEAGQGHTRHPEAVPGLPLLLCPDPNLSPTLARGPDPDPDLDLDLDLGLGTDQGLHLGGGGVFPGPQERRNLANLHLTTWSMGPTNLQTPQGLLSRERQPPLLLRASL